MPVNELSYAEAVAQATTDQGLDPIIEALKAEFPNVTADQTGGFVMVVRVSAADGGWVGIVSAEDATGSDGFYLVGYLNAEDEGNVIADGVPLEHVADYVRGFVRSHGGLRQPGISAAELAELWRSYLPFPPTPTTFSQDLVDLAAKRFGVTLDNTGRDNLASEVFDRLTPHQSESIEQVAAFVCEVLTEEAQQSLPDPYPNYPCSAEPIGEDSGKRACEYCGGGGCKSCGGTGHHVSEFATVTTAQLRDLCDTWTEHYDTVYDAVQALIAEAEHKYVEG